MAKPRPTDLKFTQSEVRHIVYLLSVHWKYPGVGDRGFGINVDEWTRVHQKLVEKFRHIDRRHS
jgi:hypothetical protein